MKNSNDTNVRVYSKIKYTPSLGCRYIKPCKADLYLYVPGNYMYRIYQHLKPIFPHRVLMCYV